MKRQREDGVTLAYSKADGNAYIFDCSEHQRLKADWMAGKAFFDGVGFYGGPLTVKLGDIVAVEYSTPEAMACARADKAADRREDALDD